MTTCLPNIGPRQQRQRLLGGVLMSLVTVVAATGLIAADARWFWRLLVAVPAAAAAFGLLQAQARTCVALAHQGLQNLGTGNEKVTTAADAQRHRAQARRVYLRVSLVTLAVALATLAL